MSERSRAESMCRGLERNPSSSRSRQRRKRWDGTMSGQVPPTAPAASSHPQVILRSRRRRPASAVRPSLRGLRERLQVSEGVTCCRLAAQYWAWPGAAAHPPTLSQWAPPAEAAAFNACCGHPAVQVRQKDVWC